MLKPPTLGSIDESVVQTQPKPTTKTVKIAVVLVVVGGILLGLLIVAAAIYDALEKADIKERGARHWLGAVRTLTRTRRRRRPNVQ